MSVKNVMRGLHMGCGEPLRRPSGLRVQRAYTPITPQRSMTRLVSPGSRR